jgi:K+-transporting ATPase KdpF subunit
VQRPGAGSVRIYAMFMPGCESLATLRRGVAYRRRLRLVKPVEVPNVHSDWGRIDGEANGRVLHRFAGRLRRPHRMARGCARAPEETAMSWVYLLSGALALLIFVYLVVALLFPEKF